MNYFLRAHGYLPGPTQRPIAAGLASGAVGLLAALPLVRRSGALVAWGGGLGLGPAAVLALWAATMAAAGALYGRIFMRAANDHRGGWLFGISYGFLWWMVGPVAIWQLLREQPFLTGRDALTLFAAHLVYGGLLGTSFPLLHPLVARRWKPGHR